MSEGLRILLVDDEEPQLKSLGGFLRKRGHTVYTATSGETGYQTARGNYVDLVLTDFRMPGWDGLTVLKELKALNPDIDVVVLTAYGNVERAVEIMKSGAYDYITKPVDLDELENLINRVWEKRRLTSENRLLREELGKRFGFDAIVWRSGVMEEVLNTAARVAPSKATVLLRGDSGTGKELVAKAIHYAGPRHGKPFVAVNIAALPDSLVESELFGHEKGSFTGATQRQVGKFEQADGGTLFIDEIGDTPLQTQAKLLRAIQSGEFQRVGGEDVVTPDARIIAATNRNLEEMINNGSFREDLYYRLNVVTITIPPLSERKEDIPPLIDHFIGKYTAQDGKAVKGMTKDALDKIMKHEFPGNVRELENMIHRAVVLSRNEYISVDDLSFIASSSEGGRSLDPTDLSNGHDEKMAAFEKEMILESLRQSGGNQSAAARLLGISERHLRSRMARLGLKSS